MNRDNGTPEETHIHAHTHTRARTHLHLPHQRIQFLFNYVGPCLPAIHAHVVRFQTAAFCPGHQLRHQSPQPRRWVARWLLIFQTGVLDSPDQARVFRKLIRAQGSSLTGLVRRGVVRRLVPPPPPPPPKGVCSHILHACWSCLWTKHHHSAQH